MDNKGEVVYLYLDDIIPNRFQPREVFDDQALKELAVSIREHGVIQPIIVRKVEDKYEIIAGERRYKASTMAGLTKIPAIIKNLDDKESSKVALIENLQRKDLSPIEEARTYQKILELEENMTQEQLAATLGKTQSSVSNKLRLLDLPEEIQDALLKEKISERHARSILSIEDKNDQIKMMDKVIAEKMTVRELDKEIKIMKGELEPDGEKPQELTVEETMPPLTPSVTEIPQEPIQKLEEDETTNNVPEATIPLATFDSNPTEIDVDKIRETSTDISQIGQIAPVVTTPQNDESNEFKFVPSFGNSAEEATPSITPVTEGDTTQSGFAQFFNPNVDNNNVASSISTPEISVPSVTPTKDISQAISDVKTTITNLQNNGYNVVFEESDNLNEYKISIQINKN